jgi:CDGSH-type Zn-finger protein
VALCRCGKSRNRPFCDGSHKLVRFTAPSGAEAGRG